MSPDDDHIADTCTHCHVFLGHIRSRRKPVQGLENNGQEWSMEVEQDYIVMSRGMKDRKVMAVGATWWCHEGET